MKGRRNRFVEGTVKDHVSNHGVSFLRIKVCYDSMIDDLGDPCLDGRCGEMIYVPMETSCDSDWSHDRVQVVA